VLMSGAPIKVGTSADFSFLLVSVLLLGLVRD
jgi:hypothetical protein